MKRFEIIKSIRYFKFNKIIITENFINLSSPLKIKSEIFSHQITRNKINEK